MPWGGVVVAAIIIAACLAAMGLAAGFLVDWLWFSALGYADVFWTILAAKVALFLTAFAASAILLWANGSLAHRLAERQRRITSVAHPWGSGGGQSLSALLARSSRGFPWSWLVTGGAVILAALIALGETGNWDLALRFIHQSAVRSKRSALWERHRFLSFLASRLCRAEELDAAELSSRAPLSPASSTGRTASSPLTGVRQRLISSSPMAPPCLASSSR